MAESPHKDITLILDSKTRWNSLFAMIDRFLVLETPVRKALIDLNLELDISATEFSAIKVCQYFIRIVFVNGHDQLYLSS